MVEFKASAGTWQATTPKPGQTIINRADQLEYIFNGEGWVQLDRWIQDSTNISTYAQRNLLPRVTAVQNIGSATKLWNNVYVNGKIIGTTTFGHSTKRTIPTPDANSNWYPDGNPYLGNWNLSLTPNFGDLVTWAGVVYTNISGANSSERVISSTVCAEKSRKSPAPGTLT